ncbi:MAG: hypothetical protein EPO46_01055 [Lysobacter sp.]|nr:MAG: hypothetical protein EPO46_01055 [Lysobacter sp.]
MSTGPVRLACLIVLLLAVLPALAGQPPIQQQMSPAEFRAAGLEKLSAEELAALNLWLGRTIETQAAQAAAAAKKKIVDENRGYFNFGSVDPIRAALTGEFRGFASGRNYTLDNGQVWKQVDDASLPGVRLQTPKVTITPSIIGNAWYLSVQGYGTRAKVQRVK